MVRRRAIIRFNTATRHALSSALALLAPDMKRALIDASEAYGRLGIRYALVGGLAAGVYGEPRMTADIDFLVGDEAFVKSGPIIGFRYPMPLQSGTRPVDPIPLPEEEHRHEILERALDVPEIDSSLGTPIPVLPPHAVAFMKLCSGRSKDLGDVVAMIRSGALAPHMPTLLGWVSDEDADVQRRLELAVSEAEEPT